MPDEALEQKLLQLEQVEQATSRDLSGVQAGIHRLLNLADELEILYAREYRDFDFAADSAKIVAWVADTLGKANLPERLISIDLGVADYALREPGAPTWSCYPDVVLGGCTEREVLEEIMLGGEPYITPDYTLPKDMVSKLTKPLEDLCQPDHEYIRKEWGIRYCVWMGLRAILINKSLVDFGLTCGKVILKQSQGVFLRGGYHQGVI